VKTDIIVHCVNCAAPLVKLFVVPELLTIFYSIIISEGECDPCTLKKQ